MVGAVIGSRSGRRVIGWGALGLILVVGVTLYAVVGAFMTFKQDAGDNQFKPSKSAISDIPPEVLPIYLKAGESRGIDWAIIAAIGKIETDHGRSTAKGVHSGVNAYGCCAGPMQFSIVPSANTWASYAVDGDGDGIKDVYNPADAIPAAADYLKASGAPKDYERAIFAYNHASWYVAQVMAQASEYRGALQDAGGANGALLANRSNAQEVLALANGVNARISLSAAGRFDLGSGAIDSRVMGLLVAIAHHHKITVTSLKTGHSYLASSGNPSNHSFGRAADIAVVDGVACSSTTQGRSGPCWELGREIAAITGPLHPTELIYGIDLDGPRGPAFAMADHADHLHVGWDAG